MNALWTNFAAYLKFLAFAKGYFGPFHATSMELTFINIESSHVLTLSARTGVCKHDKTYISARPYYCRPAEWCSVVLRIKIILAPFLINTLHCLSTFVCPFMHHILPCIIVNKFFREYSSNSVSRLLDYTLLKEWIFFSCRLL